MINACRNSIRLIENALQIGLINGNRNTVLLPWLICGHLFDGGYIKKQVWFDDFVYMEGRKFCPWLDGYRFKLRVDFWENGIAWCGSIKKKTTERGVWDISYSCSITRALHSFRFPVWPGMFESDEAPLDIETP